MRRKRKEEWKKIEKIECPKCKYRGNEGINYIKGFIQITCKECHHEFQYDHIFKIVVPFGCLIDLGTGCFVKK